MMMVGNYILFFKKKTISGKCQLEAFPGVQVRGKVLMLWKEGHPSYFPDCLMLSMS